VPNEHRPLVKPDADHEHAELDRVRRRLIARYSPSIPADVVARCVDEVVASFERARVRTFIAVLVERTSVERLRREVQLVRPPDEVGASATAAMPAAADEHDEVASAGVMAWRQPAAHARPAALRG
jgi:hypothetical protein